MAIKIIWTKQASENLENITRYLIDSWSYDSALKFKEKLNDVVDTISTYPNIGKESEKRKNVQNYLITKQNSIFYQYKDDTIIILDVFDNRQNPKKKKF